MSNEEIVRAWKDTEYRQRLSAEEQALVPEHPAGAIELPDEQLKQADGGATTILGDTNICCGTHTLLDLTDCLTLPLE